MATVLVVSILSSGLLLTGSALGWSVSVGGLEHPAIVVSAAVAIPAVALGLVVYNRR